MVEGFSDVLVVTLVRNRNSRINKTLNKDLARVNAANRFSAFAEDLHSGDEETDAFSPSRDEIKSLRVQLPSGDYHPRNMECFRYDDAGSVAERVMRDHKLPACVVKLGGKVLECGRELSEYLSEGADTLTVLLSLIGGAKGKAGKKVKAPAPKQRVPGHRIANPDMTMSRCAQKRAVASSDPFHPAARGCCMGTENHLGPSMKVTATARIPVTVGTAGYGFIAFAPNLTNDLAQWYSTSSAYAQSNLLPLSAANTLTGGVSLGVLNDLPFDKDTLTNSGFTGNTQMTGRIISAGCRVKYTGREDASGGTVLGIVGDNHQNVTRDFSGSSLGSLSFPYALASANTRIMDADGPPLVIFPVVSEEEAYVGTVAPVATDMYSYSGGSTDMAGFTYTTASTPNGSPVMALYFQGVAGNTYLVDYILHAEYVGERASASDAIESDPQGMSIVVAAATNLANQLSTGKGQKARDTWGLMRAQLLKALKGAAKIAIPIAENALVSALA